MMIAERQALKPGTSLSLDGRRCMILGVIGAGTSCIAYKAQMKLTIEEKTASRTIVLKELYPAHQNIIRGKDNSLIIPDSSQAMFEEESESFVKAAILQFEFHNEEDLTNFTSDIEVVYELNNTLYSVTGIVSGKSYDKIESENITSILKVGKALFQAISYYHKKGYLNLDIKPANIFNLPETDELVQLFDFNTVCTKEEASQGKFSYSDGYAAPEVKAAKKGGGKLSEVGEQADIYSIGAVIFEKIMGRIPKVADQRAGKRWKLETSPYLKDAVPQLQKGITDLFRKTLAIDKKDRYSSAKELIEDLDELIKLARIEVFLKNQRISPCTPRNIYISRKDILSKISKALDEKHILYLHTLGGSGKSETAREYAEQYSDKYDFIQSVFYSGSLKKTIANLDFVGLKDEYRFAHTDEDIDRLYNYKYGLLGNTTMYGTNTLLIIDNYDYNADPTSEEYKKNHNIIRELKKLNIHILFTTRVKPEDDTECLDLENMSEEELQALFFRINPKDKNDPDRMELVKEIIEVSYRHTMTVKLVAMQSAKYLKPLSKYLDILKTSGLNSGIKGRVTNEKDDESVTMSTVYDHIKALFDFDDLNDKQKYIMVNACLLPLSGLEADTFSKYIDLEHFDGASDSDCIDESIEDLVNSGWIEYADKSERRFTSKTKITLHPLVCDIVKNELKPELTDDKCRKFYVSFLDLIQEWGNKKISGNNYRIIEDSVFLLFPKVNSLFSNQALINAINYIWIELAGIFYIGNHYMPFAKQTISIIKHTIIINKELILYFGIEESYTVEYSVDIIGSKAFSDCSCLKTIIIPNNLISIGDYAFKNCFSLSNISLPSTLTRIGDGAFGSCSSLKKINIPNSVFVLGEKAFWGCSSLEKLTISNRIIQIRDYTFEECTLLNEVIIPESVIKIGSSAFSGCKSLDSIIIPNHVISIGDFAFSGCSLLKKAIISDSIKNIASGLFYHCISLNYLTIPDGVTQIGHSAFEYCSSLKDIIIPDSVEKINQQAFWGCSSLQRVVIPDSVTKIGKNAFDNCPSLCIIKNSNNSVETENEFFKDGNIPTEFIIPNTVTEIKGGEFLFCTSLKKVIIPDSVRWIENGAFLGCSSLEEIIIPNSVTRIGANAFCGCELLKIINIPHSVKRIEAKTFSGCSSLEEVFIPDTVESIDNNAFSSCKSLRSISIPIGIHRINEDAFNYPTLSIINFLNPNTVIYGSYIGYYRDNEDELYKKNKNLIIKGYKNSTAEQYANEHGFKFVRLD